MKTRLFNDNGCETLTETGRFYDERVEEALREIFQTAIAANVSLKDLVSVIMDETTAISAEERIRAGVRERAEKRKAKCAEAETSKVKPIYGD